MADDAKASKKAEEDEAALATFDHFLLHSMNDVVTECVQYLHGNINGDPKEVRISGSRGDRWRGMLAESAFQCTITGAVQANRVEVHLKASADTPLAGVKLIEEDLPIWQLDMTPAQRDELLNSAREKITRLHDMILAAQ